MQPTFEHLGNLTVQHDFFGDQAAPLNLYVYTEQGTPHQQVKVREVGRDFSLFAPAGRVQGERAILGVQIEDNLFFNYTGLELHRDRILYVYPRMGEAVMKTASYDWLPKFGRICSIPVSEDEYQKITQISIQRLEGGNATPLTVVKGEYTGTYRIDIGHFPPGGYAVTFSLSDGQHLVSKFFALGDSQIGRHLIVVSAYLQKSYAQFLHFPAQKAFWRYNLIGISEADWQATSLECTDKKGARVDFQKLAGPVSVPGGKTAYQMISSVPLAFSQQPQLQVTLNCPAFPEGLQVPDASSEQIASYKPAGMELEAYLTEVFMYL
ncbi:MAG: hypothetical protein AAGH79_14745 [Bacteroidota bacterium]